VANSPQARKRAKQNTVHRLRNHSQRSAVRTAIKKLDVAIDAGDQAQAQEAFQASASLIDKKPSVNSLVLKLLLGYCV
jgi:small subunit ribosomal protein S20